MKDQKNGGWWAETHKGKEKGGKWGQNRREAPFGGRGDRHGTIESLRAKEERGWRTKNVKIN